MTSKKRWQKRLSDYEEAIKRLEESLNKKDFTELEKDGVIQRFEFTFEQAWKTLKDYLEDQGFSDVVSPKKAIKQAFESNLLVQGNVWTDMLEDRNRLSNLYNQKISESIFDNIKSKYSQELADLLQILKKEE